MSSFQLCCSVCCGLTGLASISCDGAFSPRQWILERLEEIEDAPADNHIIIEANKTANLKGNERQQQCLSLLETITVATQNTNSTGDKTACNLLRWMSLLESGHRRWTHSLSQSAYKLLSFLLSAAKAEVLYEEVFIAAESPSATSELPHASLPQARPLSPLFYTRLMKSLLEWLTNRKTDRVHHWMAKWKMCHGFFH